MRSQFTKHKIKLRLTGIDITIGAFLIFEIVNQFYLIPAWIPYHGIALPARVPKLVNILLFILTISLLLKNLFGTPFHVQVFPNKTEMVRALWSVGLLTIFCVLIVYLGYLLSTIIILPLMIRFMGEREWKVVIPVTIVTLVALYMLFFVALGVELPRLYIWIF